MATAQTTFGFTKSDIHPGVQPTGPESSRDPFGLVAGWRAYSVWRDLSALTDAELSARGLRRADIPQRALAAVFSES